jgi:hypothetical protein
MKPIILSLAYLATVWFFFIKPSQPIHRDTSVDELLEADE